MRLILYTARSLISPYKLIYFTVFAQYGVNNKTFDVNWCVGGLALAFQTLLFSHILSVFG